MPPINPPPPRIIRFTRLTSGRLTSLYLVTFFIIVSLSLHLTWLLERSVIIILWQSRRNQDPLKLGIILYQCNVPQIGSGLQCLTIRVIAIFSDTGRDPLGEGDDLPPDGEHPRRGHQTLGGQGREGGDQGAIR